MTSGETESGRIQILKDGPYLVSGGLPLSEQWIVTNEEGESLDYREGKKYPAQAQYGLCRCGQSGNKPFCDGTHKKASFDGTETASREPYLKQAETIEGPAVRLTDTESLCAFARFCDPKGRIWNLVERTDDAEARTIVAPWQNPFAERLIGSIRRECLDHILVLHAGHLHRVLSEYFQYYHRHRTHRGLDEDCPERRPVELPEQGKIIALPWLGDLHHRYTRQAA